ncbi:MAG: serine/threonine protein kinase [Planctomycetota bacterium]|nr:serine/threonine protein kinase [Planctomycetota bacterium]
MMMEAGEAAVHAAWGDSLELLRAARAETSVRPDERMAGDDDALRSSPPPERYRLGPVIGVGGTATVYAAEQLALQRQVAIKVSSSAHRREAFRAEAVTIAELEHPNIVPVYDAGADWLVMKRIRGRNLEQLLSEGAIGLVEAVEALVKVCDAVAYAHSRGIIHRDIKPDNILIGDYGEVLLTDWGLAVAIEEGVESRPRTQRLGEVTAVTAGTPSYMAPEVALGDRTRIGRATDVFLIGATLYRCLAGRPPFTAASALDAVVQAAWNQHTPLSALRPDAPPLLLAVVERAMATDPVERPRVIDVQDRLKRWLHQSRGEAEARRLLAFADEAMASAQRTERPEDTYARYGEALSLLERASVLAPDDPRIAQRSRECLQRFMLAAAAAGETGLARLLRRGVRPPVVGPEDERIVAQIAELQRERIHLLDRLETMQRRLDDERTRLAALRRLRWLAVIGAAVGGLLVGWWLAG